MLSIIAIMLMTGCVSESQPTPFPDRESKIPDDAVKQTPAMDLNPPVLHSDAWEEPVPLPSVINTAGAEDSPFMAPDDSGLYFVFVPDVSVPPHIQLRSGAAGIYYIPKVGSGWGEVKRVRLHESSTESLDGCPTVHDGVLWFCSVRAGNHREIDIYTAKIDGHKAKDTRNAGKWLNVEVGVGEMHITPDGNEMYFHSDILGGKGMDIYVSKKVDGKWQRAEPVDAVNTDENDGFPFITHDGKELWFNRFYMGTPGTFRSKRNGTGWDPPELMISSFAGEPNLDSDGNIYFVHHFYDNGTMIEADLYMARKK